MSSNCEHVQSVLCLWEIARLLFVSFVKHDFKRLCSFVPALFLSFFQCEWHQVEPVLFVSFLCIVCYVESVGWIYLPRCKKSLLQNKGRFFRTQPFFMFVPKFPSHLIKLLCSSSHWFFSVVGFLFLSLEEKKVIWWKFDIPLGNLFFTLVFWRLLEVISNLDWFLSVHGLLWNFTHVI